MSSERERERALHSLCGSDIDWVSCDRLFHSASVSSTAALLLLRGFFCKHETICAPMNLIFLYLL